MGAKEPFGAAGLGMVGHSVALDDVPSLAPILTTMGARYVSGLGLIGLCQASR